MKCYKKAYIDPFKNKTNLILRDSDGNKIIKQNFINSHNKNINKN